MAVSLPLLLHAADRSFDSRAAASARRHDTRHKYPRKRSSRQKGSCCFHCLPPLDAKRVEQEKDTSLRIARESWWDDWAAEASFNEDLEFMDDVVLQQRFGAFANVVSREAGKEQVPVLLDTEMGQWHRNASGCWEFGYANACIGAAFPCSCCCTASGSMYYACSCVEFGVDGEWEVSAPEDGQRTALVEWTKGRLRDIIVAEEEEQRRGFFDRMFVEDTGEEGWDFLSEAASEEWSEVNETSEFEIL